MPEAQRRRELADKLRASFPKPGDGTRSARERLALDAAVVLESDATALEAVGVELVASFERRLWNRVGGNTLAKVRADCALIGKEADTALDAVALRLTEALRQRDALAKALKQAESEVNTIVDDIAVWGNYVEDSTQKWNLEVTTRALANVSLGADAALKEIGHE